MYRQFSGLGVATNISVWRVLLTHNQLPSHATQQEKLLLNIILPFSTTQAYSTNIYITSIKHMMQNDNSKNSRMNHKSLGCLSMLFLMQRIIINHIVQVESIIRLGQDIILRAAFFNEILYEDLNLVWK
jgi:hypothetical protein